MYKRQLLILAGFLIIQTSRLSAQVAYNDITIRQGASIFNDAFDNNSNSWLTDNQWLSGNVSNGEYKISCKNFNQNTGLTYRPVAIDLAKDFEIETSFRIIKGTGALVFGQTKKFDHFRIEIDPKNKLTIVKDSPSKKRAEKLFSEKVMAIKDIGFLNKITIKKIHNSYYIFVNEVFVKQLNNLVLPGDEFGFSVSLNSEISADYLNISYLTIQAAPLLAERNIGKKDSVIPEQVNVAKVTSAVIDSSSIKTPKEFIPPRVEITPIISWVSPSGLTTSLDTYSARVKVNVKSPTELKSVLFYVNGASRGEAEIQPIQGKSGIYLVEKTVNLNPGENNVYLIATNLDGSSKSDLRYFTNPITTLPEINWGIPATANATVNTEAFTMEVCIKSPADLISAKVLVDGVQMNVEKVFQKTDDDKCNYIWKPQIILKEGNNSIYVIAENVAGSITSENRIIKFSKAVAENRIALVFGNSKYITGSSLKNPVNDANLMEATLKELGFDVIKNLDSGKESMMTSIREFSRKLSTYNVALFYYAGHGIQVDGVNYLIPVDAKLDIKDDCKWEAIDVNTITDEFKKHSTSTNIVILDACRNNPYRSWARGGEQGFKALAPVNGTIISFSTSEGATAADGEGDNGLFTEELVKQMVIPQQIESVFKRTRVEVLNRSKGQQTPTEWSYLTGDFYFKR